MADRMRNSPLSIAYSPAQATPFSRRTRVRVMIKPVPNKPRLRTRPSSDKAGGGVRLHHDRTSAVARIEQSEIRGRSKSFNAAPGFHFVQSGLRRRNKGSGTP